MIAGTRGLAALGSASMNALGAWVCHLIWPGSPPPHPPSGVGWDGIGFVLTDQPGLFIESRVGSGAGGGPPGELSPPRKDCPAAGPVDRDPYVLGFGPRPLVLDPYADELALCVEVGARGKVGHVLTLRGSGQAYSDRTAVDWLRDLRFQPALRHGRPVASWHRMTVKNAPFPPPPR